eukprot:612691_1
MNARSNRKPSQPKRDMMHLNRLKIRKRSPYRDTSRRLHMLCRFNDELLLLSHCDGGNDIIHLETQPIRMNILLALSCWIITIGSLIILDGWSYFGTTTVSVNGKKENAKDTLLRYNRNDTIHLRFGDTNIDLILNPKPCVVCMDKSRTIRSRCGHNIETNPKTKLKIKENKRKFKCKWPNIPKQNERID